MARDDLFLLAITVAIGAIPTGLQTVVTTLLSIGTRELASHHAVVKDLTSAETLGSTSAICSDKTGHPHAQPDDGASHRRRRSGVDRRGAGLRSQWGDHTSGGTCSGRSGADAHGDRVVQ